MRTLLASVPQCDCISAATFGLTEQVLLAVPEQYVFGLFACFLLLRTGHIWYVTWVLLVCKLCPADCTALGWHTAVVCAACRGCFLAHSFCNLMGLPDLGFCAGTGKLGVLRPRRQVVLLCYAGGIIGFSTCLFCLTEPALYGGSWLWDLALANHADLQRSSADEI